jgi:H+/gluconate symporter-like permease
MAEVCYPHWLISCLPLLLVLSTIILPRLMTLVLGPEAIQAEGQLFAVLRFADSQPIVWPSLALMLGSLLAVLIFPEVRENALNVLGSGTQDSIMPLINTAAVIGFGGVVTHTAGFTAPPLLSAFASVSLVSAITGSASGGLQIFMQTMAPAYLEMGVDAEVLHRIATMASGGFDSLPHCGAIVAMLTITGLTHKEAYRDIGVITVVIPVLVTLAMIGVVAIVS